MIFVAHEEDVLATRAIATLQEKLDVPTYMVRILKGSEPAPFESCVFFTSQGNFPSRIFRHVTDKARDADKRKIVTPEYAQYAAECIAIRSGIEQALVMPEDQLRFLAGLTQILRSFYPPAKKLKRTARTYGPKSGYHVRRRLTWFKDHAVPQTEDASA